MNDTPIVLDSQDTELETSAIHGCGSYLRAYDRSNPPIPSGKDYQASVRCFPNGDVEVCTVRVDALNRMRNSRYQLAGQPLRIRPQEETEEPTDEELEKKAQDNKGRSIRRARQQVRWKLKVLKADHMVTFTYRENMTDVAQLKRDWEKFLRYVRAKYPNWQFLAVREYQERGALHLHVGVHGRQDINFLRRCWYRALGAPVDVTGDETPGNVHVNGAKKRWGGAGHGYKWKADKLAGYMTKYLHKAFDVAEHSSKRYWHSKGVELPEPQKIWLEASRLVDAVRETFHLVLRNANAVDTMWLSNGWDCVWMTG